MSDMVHSSLVGLIPGLQIIHEVKDDVHDETYHEKLPTDVPPLVGRERVSL